MSLRQVWLLVTSNGYSVKVRNPHRKAKADEPPTMVAVVLCADGKYRIAYNCWRRVAKDHYRMTMYRSFKMLEEAQAYIRLVHNEEI